ncbi:GNAT family N-acetyltransferase [Kitasatospora viridis]|uniref:Putative GNAT superfamily acetyltransferase n=1 Tax=Kitasatospora viridis TaxID=281105 RepID=A0A561T6Q5_9ACTN|nr:GNAT family N-acetyltransferase [Kitasatospora viridis]TWF82803.1 putative GNAT superfamily acetyltransferase [Kitasatospora viridis]
MDDQLRDAEHCAHLAAERSGVRVTALAGVAAARAGAELLNRVWAAEEAEPVATTALLRAYEYSGNYVSGAFRGGRLVAAAVGFLGVSGFLHSDVVGVAPQERGTGVGFALKLDQRAWALRHGLAEVRWTFDPLLRRNAHFNLRRLGARAVRYLPDFYGPMSDGLNAFEETDRLAVHWRLGTGRVRAAARREPPAATAASLTEAAAGAAVVVADDGAVRVPPPHARARLVAVPADVEQLRGRDRRAAARWRLVVREALTGAAAEGFRIADFTPAGSYLLIRD